MKLATIKAGGMTRFGAIVDGGFIDLSTRLKGRCDDLAGLLAANLVCEAAKLCAGEKPDFTLDQISFLHLNPRLDARIFALGVAYKDHQVETGRSGTEFPSMFSKHPQSLVGHGQPMLKPRVSDMYDFEGELVIRSSGRGRKNGHNSKTQGAGNVIANPKSGHRTRREREGSRPN